MSPREISELDLTGETRLMPVTRHNATVLIKVEVLRSEAGRFGRIDYRVRPVDGHGAMTVSHETLMTLEEARRKYPHLVASPLPR